MRAASSATASAVPTNPEPDAELAAVKARARKAYLDASRPAELLSFAKVLRTGERVGGAAGC